MAKYDGLLMYEGCLRIHSLPTEQKNITILPDIQVYHSQEIQQASEQIA